MQNNYKFFFSGFMTVTALSLSLVSAQSSAGNTDVIAEAGDICSSESDGVLASACELFFKTDGGLIEEKGCTDNGANDNGFVDYTKRNCSNNEEAQLSKSGSAVMAIEAYQRTYKAKKKATAIVKLCDYADKYDLLYAGGKLIPADGVDLGADAREIAENLGGSCY